MSWHISPWVYPVWDSLCLLDLIGYFLFHVGETEIVNQVQEVQRDPYRINSRRNTPRHILIKLTKTKQRKNIKSSNEKATSNIKGNPIHLTADLSAETL